MSPEQILAIHKQYADEFTTLAADGLNRAFSALGNSGIFDFHPAVIAITTPSFGRPALVGTLPDKPADPTLPTLGELKEFVGIPNPTYGPAPASTLGSPPAFLSPVKPSAETPGFSQAPPQLPQLPTMPGKPVFLTLPDLVLPYPTLSIPIKPDTPTVTFDGKRPADLQAIDPNTFISIYTTERDSQRNTLPAYVRANSDALVAQYVPEYALVRTQINTAITAYTNPVNGGGIGLPVNIESAIVARNSDRNNIEFQRTFDTVKETMGKMGFTMPAGALQSSLQQSRLMMGNAQVMNSAEVAVKGLELEQQQFQFMLKLGEQLEEKVLDTITAYLKLSLEIDAQAISSAKELVTAYLGGYNLQVMVYKTMYEGYATDAEVYKTKIGALEFQIRLYEAEIRAEMAKAEIDKVEVEILTAVAGVNRALADTYRAEVEAVTATLEVQRIQLAIYESSVRAYASMVQAYEARWNAYRAEVDGEVAKQRGFEAQANAYTAQVNGYKAQIEGYAAHVTALAELNRSLAGRNDATVRVYTAQAEAQIKAFEGLVAAYSAESNVVVKQADIEVEYWRTTSSLVMQEWNVAVNQTFEYAREQMNLFRGQMEAAISAANGLSQAANVAGQLAGGAMTGLTSFAGQLVSSSS